MKKIIITMFLILSLSCPCYANVVDDVGVDRVAHASVSYVICDQLKRNAGFNDFWSAVTTIALGAIKEKYIDDEWDSGDFTADCMGVLMYQISF